MAHAEQVRGDVELPTAARIDMKLEVVVIPVSDPDRAKLFYSSLGWRLDIDFKGDNYRVIQFTPPGSECSVIIGRNISAANPGSAQGLHLVVSDIVAARSDLISRGIEVSEPFHDIGGIFHHSDGTGIKDGPNPDRKSYASYVSFSDPDGNGWVLQEITARLPGLPDDTGFTAQLHEAVWGGNT
ncbi:VOC family protein [Phyllobacterium lublinensis]|uniref:VOC family protein n=1 Tax=Phyllobacterium lublinensis TaxID=2875708 RepID=UPI001CC94919|nr:VOC family protein [Phyllobacterium sp. 2063]MBZ9653630.1 glyoxalase [Phyllobacterium sp. 2063]